MTELSNNGSSGSGDKKSNTDFWQGLFNAMQDESLWLEMQKGAPAQAAQTSGEAEVKSSNDVKSRYRSGNGKSVGKVGTPRKHGSRAEKRPAPEKKRAKQHNFRETTRRIGLNPANQASPIGHTDTHKKSEGKAYFRPGFLSLVFGAVLPITALVIETNTHEMARLYFDPFPTIFHIFLFLLIPISTILTWLAVRLNLSPLYSMMSLASGMALGISVLYTLMLIPLAPMFWGLLFPYGIGFLGLSPLFSIPVILICGNTICKLADRHATFFDAHQLKHLGHLIILVMVVAVELPSTLTRAQLAEASKSSVKAGQAISWLRKWGNRDVLLRACYERSGEATDILGSLVEQQHPVSVEKARDLYYKVTGVAFNTVPIPASFRGTIKNAGLIDDPAGLNAEVKDEFDLDPDIAGELVSGVARGLSVSDSTISGSLDGSAGLASLDWDFTFENVSTIAREARANILLPPNAVVTKATLWLNELKKETVIQERNEARQTYQQAVMEHKRDPLRISMSGKDSVLVQCYPVAKGTKTRIRLHIVAPMVVTDYSEAAVVLPTFEERNFAIPIQHKIALEGKTRISVAGIESAANNATVVNARIDNSLLGRFAAIPHVRRTWDESPAPLTMRPPDSPIEARKLEYFALPDGLFQAGIVAGNYVQQPEATGRKNLTIVVDKSVTMAPYINEIVDGLASAPDNLNVTLVQVKDADELLLDSCPVNDSKYKTALDNLKTTPCEGGQIDSNALNDALQSRRGRANQVLWIHAAQPLSENPYYLNIALRERLLKLHDLQVASGPNVILNESYRCPGVTRVVRVGSLSSDINVFLKNIANGTIRRSATTHSFQNAGQNSELAQLQAYKLAVARFQDGDLNGAFEIANRYHIVTPVSSAVVTDDLDISKVEEECAEKASKDMPSRSAEVFGSIGGSLSSVVNMKSALGPVCHDTKRQLTDVEFLKVDRPQAEGVCASGLVPPPAPVATPAPSKEVYKRLPTSSFSTLLPTQHEQEKGRTTNRLQGKMSLLQPSAKSDFHGTGFGDAFSSQSSDLPSSPPVSNNEYYSRAAGAPPSMVQAQLARKKEFNYNSRPTPSEPSVREFRARAETKTEQKPLLLSTETAVDKLSSLSCAAGSVSGGTNGTIGPQAGIDPNAQMRVNVNDTYNNTGTPREAEGSDEDYAQNKSMEMPCTANSPATCRSMLWQLLISVGAGLLLLTFIAFRLYSVGKRESLQSPKEWNK